MTAILLQAWIFVTGALSVWLIANPFSHYHRLGCWIGLLGQPCWLWATYQQSQWGMFALTLIYSLSFIKGIVLHARRSSIF
jgi:hypothetical protein